MKWKKTGILLVFLASLIFLPLTAEQNPSPVPSGIKRLEKKIQVLLGNVDGVMGVAAKHLESGEEFFINGDTAFPMASTFKIPIFVEVMAQIKEGRFGLEDEISVRKTDQHLGSGMLSNLDAPGIKLSVRNLINMMMMISDNSATDILLTKVDADNVNARLRGFGIRDLTVSRTCQELIMDIIGLEYDQHRESTLDEVLTAFQKLRMTDGEAIAEARKNFNLIDKDTSTPRAMNRLLELIFTRKILDEKSCDYIVAVMKKCQTGEGRIKGDLPSGTVVAHKTGTIGETVNDVGVIILPDGLGRVALTVFSKDMKDESTEVENLIAQISRFVYDYFYFTADVN